MEKPKRKLVRIALYGTPGAGKSTTARLLKESCADEIWFSSIKLADPIYEAQASIYRIAGRPLDDFYQQDGELLGFLGSYLRQINPTVLVDRFAARLEEVCRAYEGSSFLAGLLVCDDMRHPDVDFVRALGFHLIRVIAPIEICVERRRSRGDRSLASLDHPLESSLDTVVPGDVIDNSGSLDLLYSNVRILAERMVRDSHRPADPC